MKIRLTTKLIVLYIALVILISGGIGGVYISDNLKRIKNECISTTAQFARQAMEQVDLRLKSMDQLSVDIFSDPAFREAIHMLSENKTKGLPADIHSVLNQSYFSKSDIRRVAFYTFDGEYAATGVSTPSIQQVKERADWLRENYASTFNQTNSKVFLPPALDFWNEEGEEVYVISEIRAVKDSRTMQMVGFLEIQQNVMYLDKISHMELNGQPLELVIVLREDGKVFYAGNVRPDFGERIEKIIEKTKYYKPIVETDDTIMAYVSSNNFYCYTVVLLEKKAIWDYQCSVISGSVFIMIVTMIAAVAFGLNTMRLIMRPINQFVTIIEKIDLDDLQKNIDIEPNSKEMGILISAFNNMSARIRASMLRQKKQNEYQTKALFHTLQKEMGAHFLYNSLGSIVDLCESGQNERASEVCYDLSNLLQYASDYMDRDVTLEEEMESVRAYISLMESRYRQRLKFSCEYEKDALLTTLPRLTLQPLLENAIKYSMSEQETVAIQLKIINLDSLVVVIIEDNGCGIQEERRQYIKNKVNALFHDFLGETEYEGEQAGGLGLIGTLARLHIYFGQAFQYELLNNRQGGTSIILYMSKV